MVRFLANRAPYAQELDRLLALEEVVGTSWFMEKFSSAIWEGDGNFYLSMKGFYRRAIAHLAVVEFVRFRKLHGRGIGWIDAHLLASALAERIQLWTVDVRLAAIAAELGIAYS